MNLFSTFLGVLLVGVAILSTREMLGPSAGIDRHVLAWVLIGAAVSLRDVITYGPRCYRKDFSAAKEQEKEAVA